MSRIITEKDISKKDIERYRSYTVEKGKEYKENMDTPFYKELEEDKNVLQSIIGLYNGMPDKYKELDIVQSVINFCDTCDNHDKKLSREIQGVKDALGLGDTRGFIFESIYKCLPVEYRGKDLTDSVINYLKKVSNHDIDPPKGSFIYDEETLEIKGTLEPSSSFIDTPTEQEIQQVKDTVEFLENIPRVLDVEMFSNNPTLEILREGSRIKITQDNFEIDYTPVTKSELIEYLTQRPMMSALSKNSGYVIYLKRIGTTIKVEKMLLEYAIRTDFSEQKECFSEIKSMIDQTQLIIEKTDVFSKIRKEESTVLRDVKKTPTKGDKIKDQTEFLLSLSHVKKRDKHTTEFGRVILSNDKALEWMMELIHQHMPVSYRIANPDMKSCVAEYVNTLFAPLNEK